jgi:hypothetical protein
MRLVTDARAISLEDRSTNGLSRTRFPVVQQQATPFIEGKRRIGKNKAEGKRKIKAHKTWMEQRLERFLLSSIERKVQPGGPFRLFDTGL